MRVREAVLLPPSLESLAVPSPMSYPPAALAPPTMGASPGDSPESIAFASAESVVSVHRRVEKDE